jgi:hypothetical protein
MTTGDAYWELENMDLQKVKSLTKNQIKAIALGKVALKKVWELEMLLGRKEANKRGNA